MNRNELKKLMNELNADLNKSLKNIKEEFAQAKLLISKIKSFAKSSEDFIKRISHATELESQLSNLKTNADSHLTSITSSLGSIQEHVNEMETAYQKFVEINGKITNDETGLEKILMDSQAVKQDIEATKKTAETIFKELGKLKDTAAGYTNDIKKLLQVAETTVGKITQYHKESEDLKKKIEDIFHFSSRNVHANYFDQKTKTLAKISWLWLIGSIIMVYVTIKLGDKYIFPLVKILETGTEEIAKSITIEAFLIRLAIVSPSIFFLFYFLSQFNHDRRLHEQYAFKAISMLSIESSIGLLIRSLEKNQKPDIKDEQIISFAVKTFESIYKDPTEINKRTFSIKGGNPILEFSAEVKESIGELTNTFKGLTKKK